MHVMVAQSALFGCVATICWNSRGLDDACCQSTRLVTVIVLAHEDFLPLEYPGF